MELKLRSAVFALKEFGNCPTNFLDMCSKRNV